MNSNHAVMVAPQFLLLLAVCILSVASVTTVTGYDGWMDGWMGGCTDSWWLDDRYCPCM